MTTAQKIRRITRRAQLAIANTVCPIGPADTFTVDCELSADEHDTIELNSWLEELRIQAGPHRPLTLESALADLADDYPLNCSDYVC